MLRVNIKEYKQKKSTAVVPKKSSKYHFEQKSTSHKQRRAIYVLVYL